MTRDERLARIAALWRQLLKTKSGSNEYERISTEIRMEVEALSTTR